MGTLAAIAGAVAAFIGLIMYLYKRKDDPVVAARHLDEQADKDKQELDNAIAVNDAEDLTRLFSELDDKSDSLLPEGGDSAGRPGDTGTP